MRIQLEKVEVRVRSKREVFTAVHTYTEHICECLPPEDIYRKKIIHTNHIVTHFNAGWECVLCEAKNTDTRINC